MGKVFVGGLSRDTTTTGLRCYFEQFGHISDCVVMKDRSTGAPRGFGFVTYRHQNVADHVVAQRHLIDGKEVEAKPAVPRDSDSLARPALVAPVVPSVPPVPAPPVGREVRAGELKIFVGGLSHETSELEFITYFETYGRVTDCVIMCDPHTRKPRGFGFITYDNTPSVDRVCANKFHDLNGKRVEVKRAIPQDRMLATVAAEAEGRPAEGGRFPPSRRQGGPYVGAGPHTMPAPWARPAGAYGAKPGGRPGADEAASGLEGAHLNSAISSANSVLDTPPNDVFNFPGGNYSSATRSLSQGTRVTYGARSEAQQVETSRAAAQQEALLWQLQEEQLKLQIAQQEFNAQQVKQLQEMQQLVAAQHAIVAEQSRALGSNPPHAPIYGVPPAMHPEQALQNLQAMQDTRSVPQNGPQAPSLAYLHGASGMGEVQQQMAVLNCASAEPPSAASSASEPA